MKPLVLLLILFAICAPSQAQLPVSTLSGTVTDSLTGKPLADVSVYLNNTSRGTVTKKDGGFHLLIPGGSYQLVISAIGYTTTITNINGSEPAHPLNIRLRQSASELTAVTVEPYEKRGWGKYGKFFRDNFIGTGPNAASCEILNREVLRFHFYERSNRLSVTATEPLQIENNALGYVLRESFLIQREMIVPNEEKRRVKEIYRPNYQKPGLFPMDTLYHFWEVLREPDMIRRRIAVSPDSLIIPHPGKSARGLYFDGALLVTYGVNSRTDSFHLSGIRLLSARPITIEENGNYYPLKEIVMTGYWGQSEKICNLLPLDYFPPPPDPRYPGLR